MQRLGSIVLLLLPLGALGADIYRSIDENGLVVYSDRPPEGRPAELVVVRTFTPPSGREQAPPAARANETPAQTPPRAEIPREATSDEAAAERARNCEIARERAEAYSVARRLYRTGPDGEREYLSSEELDEARARAQSDVAAWCD